MHDAEHLQSMIKVYRNVDFDEAAGALNGFITGTHYQPKRFVPQEVKNAILAVAETKWKNQHRDVLLARILNKNPTFDVSKLKDRHIWGIHDIKELLERLGYVNPITGHVIDPDDYAFDRSVAYRIPYHDSDYIINRVLVMPIQLNDAKSGGTSKNEFSTKEELLKAKRRWEGVDDRIVVVRIAP
ncbi:hypothetical protein HK100_002807 [Physocladia obscura]|uniref:Uncharacterized protein n=1 Tax=Physocladia obscura TaxID=109957 RepID=A0AAD5SXM6_9FUNG|nr:hypothetical protein HK100_002807 [Physocladia obscura]